MKRTTFLMLLAMCTSITNAALLVTQDFEGIPDTYKYNGGGQNLGTYLAGLTFSAGSILEVTTPTNTGTDSATIIDTGDTTYNVTMYPPTSGIAVLFGHDSRAIRVDFDIATNSVGIWYTSGSDFYMTAYDAAGGIVGTDSGPTTNTYGVPPGGVLAGWYGVPVYLSVSSSSWNIAYVVFHDTGNVYALDDLTYNVPEPATMLLLSLGGLFCARLKKR